MSSHSILLTHQLAQNISDSSKSATLANKASKASKSRDFGPTARASAVISTEGAHKFVVSNREDLSRREELVHAPSETIRECIKSLSLSSSYNTKLVKKYAEKKKNKSRDVHLDMMRCEKSFRDLYRTLDPDSSEPQIDFNMGALLSKLGILPSSFTATCTQLTEAITRTSNTLSSVTEMVKEALPWLSAFLKASLLCTCAGVFFYAVFNRKTVLAITSGGLISAFALVQGYNHFSDLEKILKDLQTQIDEMKSVDPSRLYTLDDSSSNQAQVSEPLVPIDQGTISKIFLSAFTCGFFTLADKSKGSFGLIKDYVVHFPSMTKGLDAIVEFCAKTATSLLNHVRKAMGYEILDSIFENKDPFLHWVNSTEKYLDQFENHEFRGSPGSYGHLTALITEGRERFQLLRATSDDSGARARMTSLMGRLAKARDTCIHENPNVVAKRPPPVCIFLYGEPGRGKSEFAQRFAMEWLKRTLSPSEYKLACDHESSFIYHRTPETQYWDGYASQAVCIFDDFLQKKEMAGGESAAMDIIRCLNGAPALLHMAALQDKGSTYFTSRLVILSCNVQVPNSPAIEVNDAMLRRPDFYVSCTFQKELLAENPKFFSANGIKKDLLEAVSRLPTWEEQMSVYDLTRYEIARQGRLPELVGSVSPSQLMDDVIGLQTRRRLFFDGKPTSNISASDASALAQKFLQNQNRAQGKLDDDNFVLRVMGPEYDKLCAIVSTYVTLGLLFGRHSSQATRLLEQAHQICIGFDVSESDFDEHFFHVLARLNKLPSAIQVAPLVLEDKVDNKTYFEKFFDALYKKTKEGLLHMWPLFKTYWPWIMGAAGAFALALTVYKTFTSWGVHDNQGESLPSRLVSKIAPVKPRTFTGFANHKPHSGVVVKAANGAECIHYANCPLHNTTSAWTNCNVMCGTHNCVHFAGCDPTKNKPQVADDMQKQLQKLLKHNYHIFMGPDELTAVGHVQMLCGRVGLLQAHTCDMISSKAREPERKVYLQVFGIKSARIEVPASVFEAAHRDENTPHFDLVMVYFGGTAVRHAPDFRKFVASYADYEKRSQLSIIAPALTSDDEKVRFVVDPKAMINYPVPGYAYGGHSYTNEVNITYHMATGPGHCGLPIVTDSVAQGKYFAGIHKCGTGKFAGAAIVCTEWLDIQTKHLLKRYPDIVNFSYIDDIDLEETSEVFPQCYPGVTLGVAPPFHVGAQTKISPLPSQVLFDIKHAPAALDFVRIGDDIVHPYFKNRDKLPRVIPSYPNVPSLRKLIREVVLNGQRIEQCDLKMWRRRLTYKEAVFGIPGTELGAIDQSTSVGYPMVLTGKVTKRSWFSCPERAAQVEKEVLQTVSALESGMRPTFFVMDCMKDELRSATKVAAAETRVINAASMVALIVNRMFFGGFAVWTQTNRVDNGIVIGMNPYSREFDVMAHLLFDRKTPFDGDSKGFDLNQHPEILHNLFCAVNDWYNDGDANIRSILSLDFINPRHLAPPISVGPKLRSELLSKPVPQDPFVVSPHLRIVNSSDNKHRSFVYETLAGHPSGHSLTAVINSWYTKAKPFCVLAFLTDLATALDALYKRKVEVQGMGDDFVNAPDNSLEDVLNAVTFSKFSESYGMVVTKSDKTAIDTPFPTEPISFLKREIRYDSDFGRYVGALDMASIVNSITWFGRSNPTDKEILNNFEMAFVELAFHGRSVYETEAPRFEKAAYLCLRRPYKAPTWSEASAMCDALDASYRP